jgi:hypothetical protein
MENQLASIATKHERRKFGHSSAVQFLEGREAAYFLWNASLKLVVGKVPA